MNDLERSFKQPVPTDLRVVLEWYDPALWSWFVNPRQSRVSDSFVMTTTGKRITRDHPDDRVVDPLWLDLENMTEHSVRTSEETHLRRVRQSVEQEKLRSAAWLDAEFIRIGSGEFFTAIYYTFSSPAWPRGSIVFGLDDSCHIYWVAHSLANWFARLTTCQGEDFGLGTDPERKPTKMEMAFFREWAEHNPQCERWRQFA